MKTKTNFIIVFSITFTLLILSSSCKRTGLDEPSPFGPSSISVILNLSATPNVLFAGTTHTATTITATLKKYDGNALSDKTIHFEITDGMNKVNVGYFEGNTAVQSKVTDANGVARVGYYGPLSNDLTADTTVYIRAKVAWDGSHFVTAYAPIDIIRDAANIIIEIAASSNALFAGTTREASTLTATLKTAEGVPMTNKAILFDIINEAGSAVNLGGFEGNELFKTVVTDSNGQATADYYGPDAAEMAAKNMTQNTSVYIRASAYWDQEISYYATAPIHIIVDTIDVTFDLRAEPNVLNCTNERPQAEIKAVFKKFDGTPITGRKIFFKIIKGPGKFSDGKTKTYALTDSNGEASMTYIGPTRDEIKLDTSVTIQGQPETSTPDYIHIEVDIRLIKGQ